MGKLFLQKRFIPYFVAFVVFVMDQVTKMIVEYGMVPGRQTIELIGALDFLRLRFIHNPGAAWGILPGFQPLFITVAIIVAAMSVWAIEHSRYDSVRTGWALVLGGGLGNMVDRLLTTRGVVDFVDMGIYGYRWPTFNVADATLTVGVIWLGYHIIISENAIPMMTETDEPSLDD